MKEIFRNKNFLRYFVADSLGKIADNYFFIFLTWLALQQTGSPAYAGALLMANAIPRLVLMLFGGVLADRFQPHVILRLGNIAQAAGLGLILVWLTIGTIPLPGLFTLAIIFGIADAFSAPASMSAIPRIVPRNLLLKANSLINGIEMGIFVAGSLIAGVVIQFGSVEFATGFNSALYIMAAVLFFTVKMKFLPEKNDTQENQLQQIKKGIAYSWKKPVLRANILLLAATNIAVSGPLTIGFLLIVTEKLGLGPIYYTAIFALYGLGTLFGAISIGLRNNVKSPGKIIIINYIINGLFFVGLAFVTNIWLIIGACFLLGFIGGVAGTINSTWIQLTTKKEMLGRVSSITMIAALAFDPISQGLSGIIAEWSIDGLFIVSGIFIILATLAVIPFNKVLLSNQELPINR